MQRIRGVLIDVSGTVHVGDKAIPGAVQALDRLRASGIPFRFCTNTTQYSGDTLANKLRKFGFDVKREEIFTSLSACRQLIQARGLSLSLGPGGFVEALEFASGIKAHVVGKPQKAFFELAIQNMGLSLPAPTSMQATTTTGTGIVMIGDDVEQDLGGGAAELGLVRYLVQTGKYRAQDENRDAFGGLDGVFADFSAVVDHVLSQRQESK
ncbi:Haloacid dehalogenase-like hydrolase domain-containing protein 2 [Linnemannia gamsii]|uniref:Haloacid dehalogenase-like hydrolase domain-containing protein 2 n=1 Tax=Linnemannia gamsii TaxID=64522 RepID=A0A9P6QZK0_9FUNG|nr:Haloacid dehalogenase-like hydrolase domain-containing protein 2 [Linnemannia gamsii]